MSSYTFIPMTNITDIDNTNFLKDYLFTSIFKKDLIIFVNRVISWRMQNQINVEEDFS